MPNLGVLLLELTNNLNPNGNENWSNLPQDAENPIYRFEKGARP